MGRMALWGAIGGAAEGVGTLARMNIEEARQKRLEALRQQNREALQTAQHTHENEDREDRQTFAEENTGPPPLDSSASSYEHDIKRVEYLKDAGHGDHSLQILGGAPWPDKASTGLEDKLPAGVKLYRQEETVLDPETDFPVTNTYYTADMSAYGTPGEIRFTPAYAYNKSTPKEKVEEGIAASKIEEEVVRRPPRKSAYMTPLNALIARLQRKDISVSQKRIALGKFYADYSYVPNAAYILMDAAMQGAAE